MPTACTSYFSNGLMLAGPFFVGGACCAIVLGILLWTGWAWRLATDVPTHRSLHARPTPRVGGWGITPASVFGIVCFAKSLLCLAVVAMALAVVCQVDDRRGLSARTRFFVQTVAAVSVCIAYSLSLPFWMVCGAVLALVWMTNLYNFMDGADGLAGGMALIGFSAYAVAAWPLVPPLAFASLAIAGAAAGFLLFNWPPAKLFMGDAGSIPLGFLAGAIGLIGWTEHAWPIWLPMVIFLPFIADATVTLVRRLLRGAKFWEAHKEHYYQRMIQMNKSHARTTRVWYLLMLIGVVLALIMKTQTSEGALERAVLIGAAWGLFLLGLGLWVDRKWAQFSQKEGHV